MQRRPMQSSLESAGRPCLIGSVRRMPPPGLIRMSSPPSSRPSSRRYIVLIAIVIAVAGGWSLFWAIGQRVFAEVVGNVREITRAEGRDLSCGNEALGGFPFRFEFSCAPLRMG